MGYADSLLTEGERIVCAPASTGCRLLGRQRAAALLLWLIAVADPVVSRFRPMSPAAFRPSSADRLCCLIVVGLGVVIFGTWLHWWTQDYMITNRRLLKVTGPVQQALGRQLAREDQRRHPVDQHVRADVQLRRSEILTAAEEAVDKYHMLNGPKEFKKTC